MYIQVKKRIIQMSSFWDVWHHAHPVFWVLPWLSRTQSVYQTFFSPSCYSISSQYLWNQLLQLPLRSEITSLSLWIWFKHLTKKSFWSSYIITDEKVSYILLPKLWIQLFNDEYLGSIATNMGFKSMQWGKARIPQSINSFRKQDVQKKTHKISFSPISHQILN